MNIQQVETHIPNVTAGLVLIITACAFCLSFYNLQRQAMEAGINVWLSWMWPVCLDCLLIAGSLMVLRSSLRKESAIVGWSVLLVFTGISTGFNVIHSPADIISRLAHAVPPVSLCVSVELLMMCIRSDMSISPDQSREKSKRSPAPPKSQDIVVRYFSANPSCSSARAARDLRMSRNTIKRFRPIQGAGT